MGRGGERGFLPGVPSPRYGYKTKTPKKPKDVKKRRTKSLREGRPKPISPWK